ncbi:MAG: hypothetical protein P8R42_06000 [Candidatus Binatia bacterium]|nr:hypothetical protein [Candidatus Binatia bacterium]
MLLPITALYAVLLALVGFGLAAWLVGARILHPIGLRVDGKFSVLRGIGAGSTALIVVVSGIWAITTAF